MLIRRAKNLGRKFFDVRNGGPTPLFWCLVGLVLAITGGILLILDIQKILDGVTTVRLVHRRAPPVWVSLHARIVFESIFCLCGILIFGRGIFLAYPQIVHHWTIRWSRHILIGAFWIVILLAALRTL